MNTATEEIDLLDQEPVFPETETGHRRKLDYLGFAPCPVRAEMRRQMHQLFRSKRPAGVGEPLWFVPSSCHDVNVYDGLWQTEDEAELPGVISEVGFGDFNRPQFIQRWLDSGVYAPISDADVRPEFRDAGLVDARGIHRVIGANVEIVLADLKRLGDRPLPKTWADILHPRFHRDIIISGEEGDIHESFLFGLNKDHGEAGLAALGANVRAFMHPAEMAKTAGSENPKGAALYILPWFFALSAPHRAATKIVWPEEGAYLSPLYAFQKRNARPEAKLALDFLCSEAWAAHLAKIGLAPARIGSPALPGKLRWLGWDYVRSHDLESMRAPLNAAFIRGRQG
jgi:ABC-type Fe3+ transport system substrate-binding protein